jgi:hypothetical protein
MRREDRIEFLKILQAHEQTLEICAACAATTRDLATEVARGSVPATNDLVQTIAEAERVLLDLVPVREEVRRLLQELS